MTSVSNDGTFNGEKLLTRGSMTQEQFHFVHLSLSRSDASTINLTAQFANGTFLECCCVEYFLELCARIRLFWCIVAEKRVRLFKLTSFTCLFIRITPFHIAQYWNYRAYFLSNSTYMDLQAHSLHMLSCQTYFGLPTPVTFMWHF